MKPLKSLIVSLLILLATLGLCAAGQTATNDIGLDVREFRLENGMQFLIVERHTTPQVACRIALRAGAALEEAGKTGIAHLLEHMMFKGTKNFGTLDPERDQRLQEEIEAAYQVILKERMKREPDKSLIKAKREKMEELRMEVQKIYVPQAFSSQLGRNGAVGINAYTSKDQTQYLASVPSDMIEQWFSIASEQVFEPAWREFYVEREVVQREWAFRYVNNPEGAAWMDLNSTAYNAHPYRDPVIGWKSDMERLSTTDAVAFHGRYYNPTNAVCVLVGDITVGQAKKLAKTYFERYPAGKPAPESVTAEPRQQGPRRSIRLLEGARTPLVRIGFHAAPMGSKDFYALDALTMVLSQGRSARLTQEIVNRGLAVEAWAYNPDNRYGGMVILGGSPKEPEQIKDRDLSGQERADLYRGQCEDLERLLLAETEKLKSQLVSRRELDRVRKLNHRQFLDRMRSNEELAETLATLEVQTGWQYLMTYLERMDQVTPEDVRDVARRVFKDENRTSVFVIPGGEPERPPEAYEEIRSVSGAAAAALIRPETLTNRSIYPTPKGWKHPLSFDRNPSRIHYPRAEIQQVGDATLIYLPDRELPFVDLVLLVKAGEVDVERDKAGLSGILEGTLVRGGTENRSPRELALLLDENAVHLSVSIGEESSEIRLSVLKEDWQKGLDLLQEVLSRPGFDPEVFRAVKEQTLIGLGRQGGDAHAVSAREAMIWHFKGHPYGRDPLLGLETVPSIQAEDLKGFLKTYFLPSNMVAAVAGDIDLADAVKDLGGLFEALDRGRVPGRQLDDPPGTPPVLALIHKPGQVQSQVTLALPGVERTDPDYWKISLLANIFGGSDSLLYTRLRDDLGLVYAAYFYETYKWKAGMLLGTIGCKADKTGEALRETVKLMKALGEDVPEKNVEQKRLDVLNSFVFNVDTPAALVEVYGRYHMRGEPLDTLERIQGAYMGATREELRGLAGRFLNPQRLQIFVVADKTTRVQVKGEESVTLDEALKALAVDLGLDYREIPLR
ncbi:MAG: insulinase family protein [Deltaproteobacteria bacterium]|nr:insulinase family protein [Deltaproteobacteria bacterium]